MIGGLVYSYNHSIVIIKENFINQTKNLCLMKIGFIGAGDMGSLNARKYAQAGFEVYACDKPGTRHDLERKFDGTGINVLDDGKAVAEISDLLLFGVETHNVAQVVEMYSRYIKQHAIVGGLTSVKDPEVKALTKHLPKKKYASIITYHNLHGPTTESSGQKLAVMSVRAHRKIYEEAKAVFSALGSEMVELSVRDHDSITADTQVVTHVGFQSMGTAWRYAKINPTTNPMYFRDIDRIAALIALRLYGSKPHINAGLAIYNPRAGSRVDKYDLSVHELNQLMIHGDRNSLTERLKRAGEFVFGHIEASPILTDEFLRESCSRHTNAEHNSRLPFLAMVDTWHKLSINPYDHLKCETPNFRIRLGIAERIFTDSSLFEESIDSLFMNGANKSLNYYFGISVKEWATAIRGGMEMQNPMEYFSKFQRTQKFFSAHLDEARKKSDELIRRLTESTKTNGKADKKMAEEIDRGLGL